MGSAAVTDFEDTYTFIGVAAQGQAVFMDIAVLGSEREALRHCEKLLTAHESGVLIELWCGADLMARVPRTVTISATRRRTDGS